MFQFAENRNAQMPAHAVEMKRLVGSRKYDAVTVTTMTSVAAGTIRLIRRR